MGAGSYTATAIGGGWQTEKDDGLYSVVRNIGTGTYTVCVKVTENWKRVVADCETEKLANILVSYLRKSRQ